VHFFFKLLNVLFTRKVNFEKTEKCCTTQECNNVITPHYYIDTSVLLENTPLVKFIRNHIRDSSSVFSISSPAKISMISLISSFSLKLYLNSLVYDRNIFGSSSKVFGNLRKFLRIFGNLREIVKNAVIGVSI